MPEFQFSAPGPAARPLRSGRVLSTFAFKVHRPGRLLERGASQARRNVTPRRGRESHAMRFRTLLCAVALAATAAPAARAQTIYVVGEYRRRKE